ncbi:Hsp20/alpha crystallin family protein [Geomonas sp. Red32]|uniref:Hsp20/alpha crystallin family protein n=1 Tax=Geomonas sp. Red32 TaxID=2912856 RepID=UPI00202CE1BA|nr:Hsp20/alpha crystallin family protein [Geomonas sp. Red32]MCM0081287.1 Hsp20/alpha crystallin family protein [Geomonas sp. Red32]
MPVIPKEPLEWLDLFRQQMDEIFRYLSTLDGRENLAEQEVTPLIDMFQTPDSLVLEVELPGCRPEDVTLSVCCSALVIEAAARDEAGAGVNYICLERSNGRYSRTIEIPPGVNLDRVRARYRRGLLTVVFPWCRESKSHIREIPIEQGD